MQRPRKRAKKCLFQVSTHCFCSCSVAAFAISSFTPVLHVPVVVTPPAQARICQPLTDPGPLQNLFDMAIVLDVVEKNRNQNQDQDEDEEDQDEEDEEDQDEEDEEDQDEEDEEDQNEEDEEPDNDVPESETPILEWILTRESGMSHSIQKELEMRRHSVSQNVVTCHPTDAYVFVLVCISSLAFDR